MHFLTRVYNNLPRENSTHIPIQTRFCAVIETECTFEHTIPSMCGMQPRANTKAPGVVVGIAVCIARCKHRKVEDPGWQHYMVHQLQPQYYANVCELFAYIHVI